jgi:hypothetical protein
MTERGRERDARGRARLTEQGEHVIGRSEAGP